MGLKFLMSGWCAIECWLIFRATGTTPSLPHQRMSSWPSFLWHDRTCAQSMCYDTWGTCWASPDGRDAPASPLHSQHARACPGRVRVGTWLPRWAALRAHLIRHLRSEPLLESEKQSWISPKHICRKEEKDQGGCHVLGMCWTLSVGVTRRGSGAWLPGVGCLGKFLGLFGLSPLLCNRWMITASAMS